MIFIFSMARIGRDSRTFSGRESRTKNGRLL